MSSGMVMLCRRQAEPAAGDTTEGGQAPQHPPDLQHHRGLHLSAQRAQRA